MIKSSGIIASRQGGVSRHCGEQIMVSRFVLRRSSGFHLVPEIGESQAVPRSTDQEVSFG